MGVTANFQGSRAQEGRHGKERIDQGQPNNVEPTARLVLRKQHSTDSASSWTKSWGVGRGARGLL